MTIKEHIESKTAIEIMDFGSRYTADDKLAGELESAVAHIIRLREFAIAAGAKDHELAQVRHERDEARKDLQTVRAILSDVVQFIV